MRTVVALIVCMLGFASVSHAAQIASPSIFGSHSQTAAFCSVVNGGTAPITVTIRILNESGGVVGGITETLAPGDIRAAATSISAGVAYACTVTASTSLAQVRATMMIMELYTNGSGLSAFRPNRSEALR